MSPSDQPGPGTADTVASGGVMHAPSSDLSTYDPQKIGTALGTPTWADRFAAIAHGIEHGANRVYHEMLAVEADVTRWTSSNPAVLPLIRAGVATATDAIARTGFPVQLISIVGDDLVSALRGIAAADNSVYGAHAMSNKPPALETGQATQPTKKGE